MDIQKARTRFMDFIDQGQVEEWSPVTIIGAGGIGSPISYKLAAMGFSLQLWDPDVVSEENIGSQSFAFPDIGQPKVEVLKSSLELAYRVQVGVKVAKFTAEEEVSGVVICGVDSLEERVEIWKAIEFNTKVPLYIDGRVGGRRFKLFCLDPCNPDMVNPYGSHLDLTIPTSDLPCTARFAPQAGSALCWSVVSVLETFIRGERVPFQIVGQNFVFRTVYIGDNDETV